MEPRPSFWAGVPVCVTGGTGFLGHHLVLRLRQLGARVRVLALAPRAEHPVRQLADVEAFFGDIRDPQIVGRAVAGCRVVFHTAGTVATWGPALETMHAIHVEGTRTVLHCAAPDTRIVHTSSLVAVAVSRDGRSVDEETPFDPDAVPLPYVHSKRAAEEAALNAAAAGRHVVVTNPAYLVGPDDHERSIMGQFCVRFWKGHLLAAPPGGLNLVDVRDVAEGHLLAAEHGQVGRRYLLGGEDHTYSSFLTLLAEAAGFQPRLLPRLPWSGLALAACVAECRGRLRGKEPYPSFAHLRLNRYRWFCRSDRAVGELGYRTRPLHESLRDAFEWHTSQGMPTPRGLGRWWLRAA